MYEIKPKIDPEEAFDTKINVILYFVTLFVLRKRDVIHRENARIAYAHKYKNIKNSFPFWSWADNNPIFPWFWLWFVFNILNLNKRNACIWFWVVCCLLKYFGISPDSIKSFHLSFLIPFYKWLLLFLEVVFNNIMVFMVTFWFGPIYLLHFLIFI